MIALFGLGWWDISDGLEQASIVEPVEPFESGDCREIGGAGLNRI
jgi:hypothetical protein